MESIKESTAAGSEPTAAGSKVSKPEVQMKAAAITKQLEAAALTEAMSLQIYLLERREGYLQREKERVGVEYQL